MASDDDLAAMTDACIEAARQIDRSGSPELQAAMRVLLLILAGDTIEAARACSGDHHRPVDADEA